MPLYTLINPHDEEVDAPYGTFPAFSVSQAIDLTNPQARDAIQGRKLILLDDGADPRTLARAAFAVIAALMPGYSTRAEREVMRSKEGAQEWSDLLDLLDRAD